MKFEILHHNKKLIFDSDLNGLSVDGVIYNSGSDGVLIYDKVGRLSGSEVVIQMSSDTSTLIPAFKVLGWQYPKYFDERPVIESQNDITFYWNKSKLAAFYNLFATDEMKYEERESTIINAVIFLLSNASKFSLPEEYLRKIKESCLLLGFYKGFPIFDSSKGLAKLQSRLGIHLDPESIMVSTPLDKYEEDVYVLARDIAAKTGQVFLKKKNRVIFPKNAAILNLLDL